MQNHDFRRSGESSASGEKKDSCLLCGRTEESHTKEKQKVAPEPVKVNPSPRIKILWQGRFYEFASAEEAKKHGFYLS